VPADPRRLEGHQAAAACNWTIRRTFALPQSTRRIGPLACEARLEELERHGTSSEDHPKRLVRGGRPFFDEGRAKTSGVRLERRHAEVWTIRGGRVVRIEPFDRKSDALEAVGLE
jgi:ketosteroid isomerase-like protein